MLQQGIRRFHDAIAWLAQIVMFATPEISMQAPLLFDVVFFIVVVSAIIQGVSLNPVARWLGLERPREPEPPVTLEISSLRHVDGKVLDYHVSEESRAAGRTVKKLALPGGVVIAMITRGDKVIPPQGITRIHAGDHVIIVLKPGTEPLVNQVFGRSPEERATVPHAVEFPFRGSTTIGELVEFYSLRIDAPGTTTLDAIMRRELGPDRTEVDAVVELVFLPPDGPATSATTAGDRIPAPRPGFLPPRLQRTRLAQREPTPFVAPHRCRCPAASGWKMTLSTRSQTGPAGTTHSNSSPSR